MSCRDIRVRYGVNARVGMIIKFCGQPVQIIDANADHLIVRSRSGLKFPIHPTKYVLYPKDCNDNGETDKHEDPLYDIYK